MPTDLRYLRNRDGVFQYERRVPLHVQRNDDLYAEFFASRPLFRRTLGSKDRAAAMLAYAAIDQEFERRVVRPTRSTSRDTGLATRPSRTLTNHDLEQISARYRALTIGPMERLHRLANVSEAAASELDRVEYELGSNADAYLCAVQSRTPSSDDPIVHPATEARLVAAERNFNAPEGSEELGTIIAAVRCGIEQGFAHITALSEGKALPALPASTKGLETRESLTLGDAVNRYLEARKLPVKAVLETKLALRQFEEEIGNRSLASLSKEDFHRFVEHLSNQVTGGKTKGSVQRHLSEQTIRKRLRMLATAIQNASDRGWFEGDNPARNIKIATFAKRADKAVMPDKRRLQVSELNLLFQHPWFVGCRSTTDTHSPGDTRLFGAEYWVPVVALYTGCRAAELGGLKVSDIRLDHPFPHLIVRDNEYRRTKSRRARCVPLLDALLRIGFSSYVERIKSDKHDRLFPDWTANVRYGGGEGDYPAWSNARLIRAFNRTVIPATLTDILSENARRDVTFHSLRGAFKAMLGTTNNVPVNIVHEVVGHAKSELDARYIGEVTIEETYPVIHRCDYKSLIIPPPPNGKAIL